MQVNTGNSINFNGVIPVRVIKDGKEVLDKSLVHKACLKVVQGLSGPLCEKPEFKVAAAQLAVMDNDYKFARAFYGYNRILPDQKLTASKFFKIIFDKFNRGYIVTGKPSERLSELGKEIGRARRECNNFDVYTSPKLEEARKNYWDEVMSIGNNLNLRIREAFAPMTLEKIGKYQQMDVNIKTKPVKVKGKPDEKVIISDISFSERKPV